MTNNCLYQGYATCKRLKIAFTQTNLPQRVGGRYDNRWVYYAKRGCPFETASLVINKLNVIYDENCYWEMYGPKLLVICTLPFTVSPINT
jgi:hypothetical protein